MIADVMTKALDGPLHEKHAVNATGFGDAKEVLGGFSADCSKSTPLLDKDIVWSVEIRHPILRNLRRLTRIPAIQIYKDKDKERSLCNPRYTLCN